MFHVSGTTIRTYLTELEKAGKLVRTHGGAMLNEDVLDMEESISARKDKRMEEKQKIAKAARAMIEDGRHDPSGQRDDDTGTCQALKGCK